LRFELPVAFILSIILVGVACGTTTTTYLEYVYKVDQSVTGNGFYSSYQNITANNLRLGNRGYGSGSYSYESTLTALNEANNNSAGEFVSDTNERHISFKETVDQVYGEANLNLGSTSFKSGPISILGKEETCVKNYGNGVTGVSMNALFDSASVLSKDLSAELYWKDIESDYLNDPDEGYSRTQKATTKLNVDATFTGKGHIGALEVNKSAHIPNKNINILVDEDYIGTFSISKKMDEEFNYRFEQKVDDWLPCCYGGWDTMRYRDQKGFGASTAGVFDCTCYKTHNAAQFTEPSETKAW
jgi:hypothetical protein